MRIEKTAFNLLLKRKCAALVGANLGALEAHCAHEEITCSKDSVRASTTMYWDSVINSREKIAPRKNGIDQ